MGKAVFEISYGLLQDLLRLPEGTEMLGVAGSSLQRTRFRVVVEHPDIPDLGGEQVVTVAVGHHRVDEENRVKLEGWEVVGYDSMPVEAARQLDDFMDRAVGSRSQMPGSG